jgi:hypothetical protein
MQHALKSLENNALAAMSSRAPRHVVSAIHEASDKTGVSFSYLMKKAAAESNFDPAVKAKTSSATGLYQFIESTWMDTVKKHGAKYGIDSGQSRQELLNLRKNPAIAAVMAAEFASDNKTHLEKQVGGTIGDTELYFAHFMGAGGASKFLNKLKQDPEANAAALFPREAKANKGVFYDRVSGAARTMKQVYEFFDKKFSADAETRVATNTNAKPKTSENAGYQHIPFSLKKPTQILSVPTPADMAIRGADAFFSRRTSETNSVFPMGMYSRLTDPTSLLLNLLSSER